ncbi:MAG: PstS family phosphate ABC transporter substrate-binding protein [Candidatus Omnitrophica bacterium]|nr:PstS family phosphate ABC transporter substrate-binding protein [Candidatus Omnitrophota bacterium]
MKKILSLVMLCLFLAANSFAAGMLQVKGSDTLINMVQKLAEDYMQANPGKMVSVTGGGSGTGISALINKKCDIADASRTMSNTEIKNALVNGVDAKRVIIALDGVAILVNGENPVKKLSVEELGKIYKGEVNNWKQVGGNDTPITLYGRQSNSGTYSFILEMVVKGEYAGTMRQMNGNSQIVESVKSDIGGIGYVGAGYLKEATGVNVVEMAKKSGEKYYLPDSENVKTSKYPLSRPLNQYVNGVPTGEAKEFITYELSAAGQKVVEEQGFFAITDEHKQYNKALGL